MWGVLYQSLMNTNEISFDASQPGLEDIKDAKPGTVIYLDVAVKVGTNEGGLITGTTSEISVCDECGGVGCPECKPEAEPAPAAAEPAPTVKPKKPSIAAQAAAEME